MENNFIGSQIRKLRKCAGLSQAQIAVAVRGNQNLVSLIERGVRKPTAEEVEGLLKAIKLIGGEEQIVNEAKERAENLARTQIMGRRQAAEPQSAGSSNVNHKIKPHGVDAQWGY